MKNIVLIGFMGVGKGTIARKFSKKHNIYCIDTDDLIESLRNREIKDIFADDGEEHFRALEQQTANWLGKNVKNTLISTGGGFYKVKDLNKIGTVVYLKSSFDGIIRRISEHKNSAEKFEKRPLLRDLEQAKQLFKSRSKEYKKCADITVHVEGKSAKQIVKELSKKLKIR